MNIPRIDQAELEKRLEAYMQTDDFSLLLNDLEQDYRWQHLPVPSKEQLRAEAVDQARKSLENVMICEKKGHLWHETADPENGTSEIKGDPAEAQRSGFGWERRSSEVSELSPQAEAKDTELATTRRRCGRSDTLRW